MNTPIPTRNPKPNPSQIPSSAIRIDRPTTDGTTLECGIQPTADCRRYVTDEPFRVEYETSLESVPDAILVIPVLAHICPVAWATGADVYVEEVDATFARALEDVKATLLSLYPDFLEGGQLYAREIVDVADSRAGDGMDDGRTETADEPENEAKSGLLFTGGVDSTCSYVRHREKEPTLISVRGWTITPEPDDDENWHHLRQRVERFGADHDLETHCIDANMLSVLNHPMLLAHFKRYVDGGWYSSVGHGLGLLGLCAPMAYAEGIDDLYLAATHWEGIDLEWGSRPDIDDYVRWAGTACHHDAYELTRQERLDVLAEYVADGNDLELQTCNIRMDGNCSACEKCYRTAIGLRLSGLEPSDHGYDFSHEAYATVRRSFERGDWILGQDERHMWADLRERARDTEPESAAERVFFLWLEGANLDALVEEAEQPLSHRLLRAGARNAPNSVFTTLYPAWKEAKERVRSDRS